MHDERLQQILKDFTHAAQDAFGENLTGVYVHGSLAFGCFQWMHSDIDLLVVVDEKPTDDEKRALMRSISVIEAAGLPGKGLEMSVVLAEHCRHFKYPTPYELHYSPAFYNAYRNDPEGFPATKHGHDPDLAAHFTVTRAVGYPLCGKPVEDVFGPVPSASYIASLWYDIKSAVEDIRENPVYVVLNLCRVAAYLMEGGVLSKAQGGEWGIQHLPADMRHMVLSALELYEAKDEIAPFLPYDERKIWARKMLDMIEAAMELQ